MSNQKLQITEDNYNKLKEAYNQAVKEDSEEFVFEGTTLVVAYTKYLLEFMDLEL